MTASPRRPGSEQRKPSQFPLIPPLPPSNVYDKENQRQPEAQQSQNNDDSMSRFTQKKPASSHHVRGGSSSMSLTPQSRNSPFSVKPLSARREDSSASSLSQSQPPVIRRHSQGSTRRVLRYGETIDSLFCLTNSTPSQHRQLCRDIVEGPLADDCRAWLRAVKVAASQVAENLGSAEQGANLIRLLRRATSRFSSLPEQNLRKNEETIFQLWLAYAEVQALYGTAEDARLTFRHIQNQKVGVSKALYYVKFAEFERKHDPFRAIHVLKLGMEQNAEPRQLLYDAVKAIESSNHSSNSIKTKSPQRVRNSKSTSPIPKLSSASTLQSKKRKSEQDTSPKRLKKSDDVSAEAISSATSVTASARPRTALGPAHRSNEKVTFAEGTSVEPTSRMKGCEIASTKSPPSRTPLSSGPSRPAFGSVSVLKSSQRRPSSLSSKTPGLSRVGLSGKPMRVNADDNPATDSSDSSMDTATRSETIDAKALIENISDCMDITATKPAPKISKMDLSYMLNWDPHSRQLPSASKKDCKDADAEDNGQQNQSSKQRTPPMDTIKEGSSNGSAASLVTSTLTSVHSNATKTLHSHQHTQHSNRSDGSNESNYGIALNVLDASNRPATVEPTASLDQTALLVSKSNPDFLPLVSEDNILRVNKVPYVKLGVIGKGGSCKVYRALSKDCSILAIKKVKLGGKDKKAIHGYANEIALLKRLRGNPSIIQMFDSEVDLSRKAIFVAMELGEVDLNQVIQQQTLSSADGSAATRSALDMNFIRLTWQQMLKAVHSIHEERIIHGDLKPANFLFVRGALKLIDFGIAKAIQSDDTTNIYRDSQIGTLNYMSPEAILDTGSGTNGARMRIGRASDVWSLGCILYQMVYGKTPFADLHMIQKLQAIVNPNHKISFPLGVEDEGAVDAIKLCLRRRAEERPPIDGDNGLLNVHYFLNSGSRPRPSRRGRD